MVAAAQDHFATRRPTLVQAARRGPANRLKKRIAEILEREAGRSFEVVLLNTGTEAVEAALKHARLELVERQLDIAKRVDGALRRLQRKVQSEGLTLSKAFCRECEHALGVEPIKGVGALALALAGANGPALEHPGYFAAVEGGFHGKTLGALTLTWKPDARLPLSHGTPRVHFLRPNTDDLDRLDAELVATVYDLKLNPLRIVKKELPLPRRRLRGAHPRRRGCLRDRGRPGGAHHRLPRKAPRSAHRRRRDPDGPRADRRPLRRRAAEIPADYITMGKSLGGSLAKVSALAIATDCYRSVYSLLHTSTFADDEFCAAIARTIDVIERDRLAERSALLGGELRQALNRVCAKWPGVVSAVRGRGLMQCIEFREPSPSSAGAFRALGEEALLTVLIAGYLLHVHDVRTMPTVGRRTVLRFQPSAYVQRKEIDRLEKALDDVSAILAARDAYALTRYMVHAKRVSPATPRVYCEAGSVAPGAAEGSPRRARASPSSRTSSTATTCASGTARSTPSAPPRSRASSTACRASSSRAS